MIPKKETIKVFLILDAVLIAITLLMWLPYFLRLNSFFGLDFSAGFNTIIRNFDGLEYVITAKTLYFPEKLASIPQSLPANYYAAHFPGYSLAILAFAPVLGFLKSMLFVSLFSTILAAKMFYFLVRDFKLSNHPLLLSIIFFILPARWLIVHSVGSSEPLFIFLIIASIYWYMKFEEHKKGWQIYLAGLAGMGAVITRPPGMLLFIAFGLYLVFKLIRDKSYTSIGKLIKAKLPYYPLALMPLGLGAVFAWYQVAFNDFFAYFHSGDNIHLLFPPFQVFNKHQFWVGDMWLEDIVYILIFTLLGGIYLVKRKLYIMAFFVFTYFAATSMVAHRDISRYIMPVFPFILIAFEKVLTSKEFRIVLIILSLAIYLYSQNFIIENVAPFPNPEAFD